MTVTLPDTAGPAVPPPSGGLGGLLAYAGVTAACACACAALLAALINLIG